MATAKSEKKFRKKHLKHVIARRCKLRPMKKALQREIREKEGKTNKKAGEPFQKRNMQGMDDKELPEEDFWNAEIEKKDASEDEDSSYSEDPLLIEDDSNDFIDVTPLELKCDDESQDDENEDSGLSSQNKSLRSEIGKHKMQLQSLQEKDPEFFQFLKKHDKELLEFSDDDDDVDGTDNEEFSERLETGCIEPTFEEAKLSQEGNLEPSTLSLTSGLVDTWCQAIKDKQHMGSLHNLLRAFRTACHYGDGQDNLTSKYNISSSHVFNRIMIFTLSEMDGVFRKHLQLDSKSERFLKEMSFSDIQKIPRWKKLEPLVKSYFGNTLHILNQMIDNQMIAYTLKRLKASIIFLGPFPKFARKYLKIAVHFWGRGQGALPIVSFLFVRDMALWLGTEYLDSCLKGIYKEYVASSKFMNVSLLPHLHFMENCVVELYGIDLIASYQHAFVFIRELAIVLRNALTMKTKECFKNVYNWQYINCLDIWVKIVCTYASKKELQPLVYPLSQIIGGVARLLPTARYFPLRLRCARMLNKLASGTGTFIPVAALLLDMLQFKELRGSPTGGVGKFINFNITLKITKPTLKTRGFQEECVSTVMEQLVEHLSQYSYEIAFPELALIPLLRLRSFIKGTKVERFRRQVKQLVDAIERNIEYVGKRRDNVNFSPKDVSLVSAFLQVEKHAGCSPLSQLAVNLRQRVQQRQASLGTSSILISDWDQEAQLKDLPDDQEAEDIKEEALKAFSSEWPPPRDAKGNKGALEKLEATGVKQGEDKEREEDVLVDLELSSSSDDDDDDADKHVEVENGKSPTRKRKSLEGVLSLKAKRSHGSIIKTSMKKNQRINLQNSGERRKKKKSKYTGNNSKF